MVIWRRQVRESEVIQTKPGVSSWRWPCEVCYFRAVGRLSLLAFHFLYFDALFNSLGSHSILRRWLSPPEPECNNFFVEIAVLNILVEDLKVTNRCWNCLLVSNCIYLEICRNIAKPLSNINPRSFSPHPSSDKKLKFFRSSDHTRKYGIHMCTIHYWRENVLISFTRDTSGSLASN